MIPRSASTSARLRPSSVVPWNAEYAGLPCPFFTWTSIAEASSAGWYSAPGVPATQCTGHVTVKSGAASVAKWPPLSSSPSCQSREAATSS